MVKEIIDSIFPISQNAFKTIEAFLEYENFEKGDLFIQEDHRNEKEYFVLEGVCNSYLINPEGEEITISFFTDNSILSPYTTRTNNSFSILNFKALTQLKLASVNAKVFEDLMVRNVEIRNFGNAVLQNELMK
ncbi:MAG: Crp/Fnr family transcriptional regulator, partial [Mariniphaga sp.]